MSGPESRRGFLRDLAGLPLIGGGLALIGAPSAVALPATDAMLRTYETWVGIEHYRIARELRGPSVQHVGWQAYGPAYDWHMARSDLDPPSNRAALVLSAVGCGWEGDPCA